MFVTMTCLSVLSPPAFWLLSITDLQGPVSLLAVQSGHIVIFGGFVLQLCMCNHY
jgi:hypothetical protein